METAQVMSHSSEAVGDLARQAGALQQIIGGMRSDGSGQALSM